ncbi:MAG: hypothetical protein CM1200mP9_09950 [Gammaproteobacteria bacterium]|nr:MAG: hypothetical protein CM1200mP9_09950 [Gammaproteobacteria bacterium]
MAGGVTVADPSRLDLRGTLTAGQDCFIDINVVIEGAVTIGDNVTIGTGMCCIGFPSGRRRRH